MAGSYSDAPGHRMAYDRDGSIGVAINYNLSSLTQATSAQLVAMNDEASGQWQFINSGANYAAGVCIIFPELRDIDGVWFGGSMNPSEDGYWTTFQWSADTTTGLDGTWTTVTGPAISSPSDKASMRDGVTALALTGVKAIRQNVQLVNDVGGGNDYATASIHIFGTPSTGEAADRLQLWHPTLDEQVGPAYFDWGDVARSTTAELTFRVHNPSGLTAEGVAVSAEVLTDSTPSISSQHTFSYDGGAFGTTATVGDLAPGTTSDLVTVKRTISSGAALGLWWLRFVAAASGYS